MTAWFISDLHLEPKYTQITQGFLDFLNKPAQGDDLYILGDFFNYWVGDDFTNEYVDGIKKALKGCSDRGVQLFFMHGNRDFLIGEQFCNEAGCTLLPDPHILELNDKRYLLMHGDSLCTTDTEYMKLRSMLRNPAWQQQFLGLSIEQRIAFAQDARAQSQSKHQERVQEAGEEVIIDVTLSEVDKALIEHDADIMIHGHTHRPAMHDIQLNDKTLQRIVLGDWYKQGWYLKLSDTSTDLIKFELPF